MCVFRRDGADDYDDYDDDDDDDDASIGCRRLCHVCSGVKVLTLLVRRC